MCKNPDVDVRGGVVFAYMQDTLSSRALGLALCSAFRPSVRASKSILHTRVVLEIRSQPDKGRGWFENPRFRWTSFVDGPLPVYPARISFSLGPST